MHHPGRRPRALATCDGGLLRPAVTSVVVLAVGSGLGGSACRPETLRLDATVVDCTMDGECPGGWVCRDGVCHPVLGDEAAEPAADGRGGDGATMADGGEGETEPAGDGDDRADGGADQGPEAEPECGNGQIELGEGCDDGDPDAGDGCSSACAVEGGWSCAGEPSVCTFVACSGGTPDCSDARCAGVECPDEGSPCTADRCGGGICAHVATCAGSDTACGCTSCQSCNALDGWVDTATTRWVATTQCLQTQQRYQELLDYRCVGVSCTASATSGRWVDIGSQVTTGAACGAGPVTCSYQDTCDAAGVCQPNHWVDGTDCGSSCDGLQWTHRSCAQGSCGQSTESCASASPCEQHHCDPALGCQHPRIGYPVVLTASSSHLLYWEDSRVGDCDTATPWSSELSARTDEEWLAFYYSPAASVTEVILYPRHSAGTTPCVPEWVDLYYDGGANNWVFIGRFNLPSYLADGTPLGFAATPVTNGILIRSSLLRDDGTAGNYYFQMAEVLVR